MAINSLADYATALKQRVVFNKGGVSVFGLYYVSTLYAAGIPEASSALSGLAVTGDVPVSGDVGFPRIQPFSGNGYLSGVEFYSGSDTNQGRVMLYDRLFHCGPYPQNAASQTLSGQPSFSSRVPGGTDYAGTQLFLELKNLFITPSSYTVTITYTNQAGTTGRSTSIVVGATGGSTGTNWAVPIPLASGDCGIQTIESVSGSAGPAGDFCLFIARPLWLGFSDVSVVGPKVEPMDSVGMPEVFSDSALAMLYASTSSGVAISGSELSLEIASK